MRGCSLQGKSKPVFRFGPFQLDAAERLLTRDGEPVALPRRAFDTLLELVENRGHLVSKNDLMSAVWPDCHVGEANLMVSISTVRKALGDEEPERKYIQTVPTAGYRFIGEVTEVWPDVRSDVAVAAPAAVPRVPPPLPFPVAGSRIFAGLWAALATLVTVAVIVWIRQDVSLTPPPRQASQVTAPPGSSEAYANYMRGRLLWNRRTAESLVRGIEYFRKAIQADPNYAAAYAGLADSYALMASFSVEPGAKAHSDALAAAERAMELDPSLAEPRAALGMIAFFSDWNWRGAEHRFREAIQLQPGYATAHHWYGLDLAAMGRLPESLAEVQRAERLDPNSLIIATNVGWVLYFSRRYDDAIAQYRRALDLDPAFARARTRLGIALAMKQNYSAALPELQQAVTLSGGDPYVEGVLGYVLARSGDRAGAAKILRQSEARSAQQYVPPFGNALVCIGLGQTGEALHWLEQAVEDHSTSMVYAKVDPILDPVRDELRFRALLSRMNF